MNESCMVERKPADVSRVDETTRSRTFKPAVDILERADELLVRADMPGVAAKDVDVRFENGTLTIQGRVEPRATGSANPLRCEYGVGDYFREFRVGEAIDASRISAECKHGVLTLHLPKVEAVKPRKIEVKA